MLEHITDHMWTVAVDFKIFGLIALNGRSVIIRLKEDELWVHSPVRLSDELKAQINQLGQVKHIVAPSLLHHLYVGDWRDAYPEAQVYAPTGIEKKQPQLEIDHYLSDHDQIIAQQWSDEIDHVCLRGMPAVREHLFYHRASKTVLVTDFCFYFHEASGFTKFYLKLNRVYQQLNMPLLFKSAIKDKQSFRDSIEIVKNWDVQRVTLCHNAVLNENAQECWDACLS